MRKIFARYVCLKLIIWTIILSPFMLLWGELFTRMLLPQNVDSRMNIFREDPVVGFTYEPHAQTYEKGREYNALYNINSLGLRDREYGSKEKNEFRVLLLGDSFSVSHGMKIEDSLSRQLEDSLQRLVDRDDLGYQIKVVNAAHGGYSPYNYWKAYQKWEPILEPDAVAVGLSPDDYDCSNEEANYLIEDGETLARYREGEVPRIGKSGVLRKARKWLSWNSEFYVLMRNFFYYNDLAGWFLKWRSAEEAGRNVQFEQFSTPQPEHMQSSWKKSFEYLGKLKEETGADGIPMVVIPIPLKIEIDQQELDRVMHGSNLDAESFDINQPLRMIEAFGRSENIPVLDPRSALRERHRETPCYFVYDGHWIAEGIQAATESIASQWRERSITPW